MTERDVDNAPLSEVLHIFDIVFKGQRVLNAEHDGLALVALVVIEVTRRLGEGDVIRIVANDLLYFVENKVGILFWGGPPLSPQLGGGREEGR